MPLSEYESAQIENEVTKLAQEEAHKRHDLTLREAELELHRSTRYTPLATALIAAVALILGAGAGALLQGYANLKLERSKYDFSKEIERQKLESSLVVQAVSTGRQEDSIRNLRFLVRLNLISEEALKRNLTELLDNTPEQTAVLPATSPGDLLRQGIDKASRGSLNEAIEFYQQALKQDPQNPVVLHFLGYALFRQGKIVEAISKLEQAVASDPKLTWAYYNLALAYFQSGRDADGAATIQKLLRLDSTFKETIKKDKQYRPFLDAQPALRSLIGES